MFSGFIYKIIADDTDLVYYGSTTQILNNRFSKHKSDFKCKSRLKCTSIELFNFPNTRIEVLETHTNIDKDVLKNELKIIESNYIKTNTCVNNNIPNRTQKEYVRDNRKQINQFMKEYMKEYRIQNKQIEKKRQTDYYIKNKERIKQYNTERYQKTKLGNESLQH